MIDCMPHVIALVFMNAYIFIFSISMVQSTVATQIKCLYAHSLKNINWNDQ